MERLMKTAAVGLLLAILAPGAAAQSDARNAMGVPASTVFKSMLRFAAIGEWTKVEKSLDLLKPVLAEHAAVLGNSRSNAVLERIRSRNTETVQDGIRQLIARDAAVLLRSVPGTPLDRSRTLSRTAALEWRIVEEDVRATDSHRADVIGGAFQVLFEAVETRDDARIYASAGGIEKDLLGLFVK
jgi:hypothetical protein